MSIQFDLRFLHAHSHTMIIRHLFSPWKNPTYYRYVSYYCKDSITINSVSFDCTLYRVVTTMKVMLLDNITYDYVLLGKFLLVTSS